MRQRSDPNEILKQIVKLSSGRHRIYLGMAPGVGKTFKMLEEAREFKKRGVDIVVGYLEEQGRADNISAIKDFEVIPRKKYVVNGKEFFDLDLEAIIERKPASVIIDELAHSNLPGSLNQKRYEDVEELLKKGISVLSSLNVHQIESIAPLVEKNVGVKVKETVPDWVVNKVDELIVIDMPIDDLYKRLENKNIYTKDQLKHAMKNFFKRNNLLMLRDLALNFIAEKVDTQVVRQKLKAKIKERILVFLTENSSVDKVIDLTTDIAKTIHADIDIIYSTKKLSKKDEEIIAKTRKKVKGIKGNFILASDSKTKRSELLINFIKTNRTTLLVTDKNSSKKLTYITMRILKEITNLEIMVLGNVEREVVQIPPEEKETFEVKSDFKPGELKIYIGMAPGVGKTYRMLQEAREKYKNGKNIVLGVIDTHDRVDTVKLMAGLPVLPPKLIKHQGKHFQEFDLEGAILKKPEVIFVDELAHTNVPGAINNKRYQDVQYLLRAGINVVTTVNIQHIESLNDIVEQFSGIKVRETVPDWIISHASEIVLIDISPEDLQERLKEGKVYSLDKIEQALSHFFQKKNLIALRELSLREVAENVEHELNPRERLTKILSIVDINKDTLRLIRKSARIANRLQAELIVIHIVKDTNKLLESRKLSIIELEELVVELGGDFRLIEGKDITKEIYAIEKKIKPYYIILGESLETSSMKFFKKKVVKDLLKGELNSNIWVIGKHSIED